MIAKSAPFASYPEFEYPQGKRARTCRFYRAYGLTIASDVSLPELEPTTPATADVVIHVGPIDLPKPSPELGSDFRIEADRPYLAWHAARAFPIRDTRPLRR